MTEENTYSQDYEFTTTRKALKPLPLPHLTGMKLARDIRIGDFIFNTIDEFGVVWVVTDMEGWWNHPESDVPDIPRGYGDGSYDVKGRYRARTINFTGSFLTPDPSLVEYARDRLSKAVDLVYKGAWLKTGFNPTRASWVRSTGSVSFATVNARGRTNFSITLRAVDPIKYSWNDAEPDGYYIVEAYVKNIQTSESGVFTVVNEGNYPVPVIFEVSGPLTGPATIFNRTSNEIILITEGLLGAKQSIVSAKQMVFNETTLKDIATIYTKTPHSFIVGNSVAVYGVPGDPFNGVFNITSIPTSISFTYEPYQNVSLVNQIVSKALSASQATLTTISPHGFAVNDSIFVTEVDPLFNGTYKVTSVPTSTSFTYTKTRVPTATVSGAKIVSNVATVTTTARHNFATGETVTVAINNLNYDGNYTITSISSDGLQFSYVRKRDIDQLLSRTQMTSLVATITTQAAHGFIIGDTVKISGASENYNGSYEIASVPSTTTFTFNKPRSSRLSVITKSSSGGSATLTTSTAHGLSIGESVTVSGVGSPFDGTFVITDVPSLTTFSYAVAGTVIPTTVTNCFAVGSRLMITSKSLIGSVATLSTRTSHGFNVGETVTVQNLDTTFNGSYIITAVTNNSFSYIKSSGTNISPVGTYFSVTQRQIVSNVATLTFAEAHGFVVGNVISTQKVDGITDGTKTITAVPSNTQIQFSQTAADLANASAGSNAIVFSGFASSSGSIASETLTTATVSCGVDLPFFTYGGTASVSTTVPTTSAVGVAVKKNETIYTPGLDAADLKPTATVESDILEIDTLDREVAFNGETIGSRGKIDVLADFIYLQPGENILEFEDIGSSTSTATIRVLYRSGWLS